MKLPFRACAHKFLRGLIFGMPRWEQIALAFLAALFVIFTARFIVFEIRRPPQSDKTIFAEGTAGHIATINPLFVDFNDTDRDISQLVFSGLMRYDPQKRNFLPDLASDWQRTPGGRTYTFTLRSDALWHDETPVTIDDVIFTFQNVIQDPAFRNPVLKNAFANVEVKKTGTSTVAFTLPKPNSYFISYVTVGLIPEHILKDTPVEALQKSAFGKHPTGSGSYKVTGLNLDDDGDFVDLESFPKYYGAAPQIKNIRFYTFPDEEELLDDQDTLNALSKLRSPLETDRFISYPYTLNQFTALYFNTERPLLNDKKMRRALLTGLNKDILVQPDEKRVDSLDLADRRSEPQFAYNPGSSSKMLDELGLKQKNEDGIRMTAKSEPVIFTLLANDYIASEIPLGIQESWKEIGIGIKVEVADNEDFYKRVSERQYDLLLIRQNLGYNRDVYPLFHSSQGGQGEFPGINFSNFKSFKTDGLTEALRRERDPPSKEKLLTELIKTISDETPLIFISTPVYSYALDRRVSSFPETAHLDYHSDRLSVTPYLNFKLLND